MSPSSRRSLRLAALVLPLGTMGALLMAGAAAPGDSPRTALDDAPAAKTVDFAKDIQPIFKDSCIKCHSIDPDNPRKKAAGKFRLDDKDAAMKGGEFGKDIIAGNSKDSLLYKLLLGPVTIDKEDVPAMPKAKRGEKWTPLKDDQVALIKNWIDQGAKWPD